MKQQFVHAKKSDIFQKILAIDSYLDIPANSDSLFSLLGWSQVESDELIRIELIHTINLLLIELKI